MSQRRLAYLENRKVLGDSGEVTTSVTVRDPITALWVELRATNGSTSNKANPVAAVLDEISVVDGSDVLVSLDGYEAFAYGAYRLGYVPHQLITEIESATQNLYFPIFFGRWLGDVDLALDPTRFSNLQVRLKWNLSNVRAVGATGFATGSAQYTVVADVLEGVQAPSGVLTTKEHYLFTTGASGVEYVDLPTDYPHKALYIRSHEAGVGRLSGVSNLKVSCDNGKYVPFDMRADDLKRWATLSSPPLHYRHGLKAANGNTVYFALKQDEQVVYQAEVADAVVTAANNGIGEQTLNVYVAGTGSTTDRNIWALVHGWMPWGTVYIPWGEWDDPNTWLSPTTYRSIRLEITQDNAGATCAVVVEQARMY